MQRCTGSLEQYQNAAYAQRFTHTIEALHEAEQKLRPGQRPVLTEKAARSLYKLMAYKDEYEVARLFSAPAFRQDLEQQFEGDFSLRFHFAPPLLARRDPSTGRPRKITLGPRTATLLRWMAKEKRCATPHWTRLATPMNAVWNVVSGVNTRTCSSA